MGRASYVWKLIWVENFAKNIISEVSRVETNRKKDWHENEIYPSLPLALWIEMDHFSAQFFIICSIAALYTFIVLAVINLVPQ